MNISNGIIYTIKEQNVTDVIIGLHKYSSPENFIGPTTEHILKNVTESVFIYKSVQPFNTIKRMLVAVPAKAELEPGFSHWVSKLSTIAKEGGITIEFFANQDTIKELNDLQKLNANAPKMNFHLFSNWEDFLIFSRELKKNDLLVIVSSRKKHVSYNVAFEKLPYYLSNYFSESNFILLYPKQIELGIKMEDVQHFDSTMAEAISEKVGV